MKKEITLCDSCGEEVNEATIANAKNPMVGEGKNARAFSFELGFHPMTHGAASRAGASRPGPAPDFCVPCALAIVEGGLRMRQSVAEEAA